jgi:hypothetical protein
MTPEEPVSAITEDEFRVEKLRPALAVAEPWPQAG